MIRGFNLTRLAAADWQASHDPRLSADEGRGMMTLAEDEQATRGEDAATAPISTDTKGTTK